MCYNKNMEELLKEGERLEDLQCGGMTIAQNPQWYLFTTDSVLLANYVKLPKNAVACEFGSGCGVVSVLVAYKQHPKRLIALELQPHLADLTRRNALRNGLGIETVQGDVRQAAQILGAGVADVVFCNPPYRKQNAGPVQSNETQRICRHEVTLTLPQLAESAARVLKSRGSLYLVHQPERFAELCVTLGQQRLVVKEACLVYPRPGAEPCLVLVKAVKEGKHGMRWKSLTLYDEAGNYTEQAQKIYGESYGKQKG